MKLGIITDTHGDAARTQQAMTLFTAHGAAQLIHCGDIGSCDVIDAITASGLPCHFVFGNCDGGSLRDAVALAIYGTAHTLHGDGDVGELEIEGCRIFFLHGHQTSRLHSAIAAGVWDVVCYGHTHVADVTMLGETLVLNPGALHRVATPTVAILDTETLSVMTLSLTHLHSHQRSRE